MSEKRNIDIIKSLPDEFDFKYIHSKSTFHAKRQHHKYYITWDGGSTTTDLHSFRLMILHKEYIPIL